MSYVFSFHIKNGTAITGWSTAEPAYDGTSTNSLYTCDLTGFTDGTVSWTPVSKSSSYEAAKQAYNKAGSVETALGNEVNARKAIYGTCTTAAGTQAKAVTCANFSLYTGATVTVGFTNANTHATPTMNVNSTGAKTIRGYTGAALTAAEYQWVAGAAVTFVYDGTYWRMQDGGALQAKADAASSASAAGTSASNAASSASSASTSATNAAGSASTASSKATEASTSATNAASSASAASTSASNAATSASTASTKASNASTSASNAAASATSAATSAQTALDTVTVKDTRSNNQNPQWYITNYPKKRVVEFKSTSTIGLSGDTYCWLQTDVPWGDSSGGWPKQTAEVNGKQYWRQGTNGTTWSAWVDAYGTAVNSAKTATNYLTETTANGLMVHPSSDSTTGWRIKDALELLVSGVSHIWAGIQNSVALVRVGLSTAGNIIMSGDGYVDVRHGTSVMAHFGYGQGAAMSGSGTQPFYVFGIKNSSAPGNYSFNAGYYNESNGYLSNAQGYRNTVSGGLCGQACGMYLQTEKALQTVIGVANVKDTTTGQRYIQTGSVAQDDMGKYAFIIGNGTLRQPLPYVSGESDILRSNAFTVDWNGLTDCAGGYTIGGNKLIKVATCTKDNISIAKSSTASGTITPTAYTGYTPIGVIGYDMNTASSSGAYLANCVPLAINFSGGTVSYQVRNNNSSNAAKIKVIARVLYVRTELI